MKKKNQTIPTPFVWMSRELLQSDAWRSQNIHVRRLIDFLLLEHLRHGGKKNGLLKAPQRQLYAFGIWQHDAAPAIVRAEESGLIACIRGGMRIATTYRLTWLPGHNDSAPTNEWRAYRNPDLQSRVPKNLPVTQQAQSQNLPVTQQAKFQNLPVKQQADGAHPLPVKRQAPSRKESLVQGTSMDASREASVVVPWPGRKRGHPRHPHPGKERP
jgi:hypothetical protein